MQILLVERWVTAACARCAAHHPHDSLLWLYACCKAQRQSKNTLLIRLISVTTFAERTEKGEFINLTTLRGQNYVKLPLSSIATGVGKCCPISLRLIGLTGSV